jgi:LmbE family N-acetylglucosaminyl deacetylase
MDVLTQPSFDLATYNIESHWFQRKSATRNLLIVYAHPDDETFSNAGTIARYTNAGVAVHYVCATYGECGTVSPEQLKGYPDITALRRAELLCAAHTLKLASVHFLGYRDSGMRGSPDNQHPNAFVRAPLEDVVCQLVAVIRTVRPQVVVTFNGYGGYGHPDHIMAHRATVEAFFAADDPQRFPEDLAWEPKKLYYTNLGARWLKLMCIGLRILGKNPRRYGTNADTDLVEAAARADTITTAIYTGTYLDQKERAWRCYPTQIGDMSILLMFPRFMRRWLVGSEYFTRVIPFWQEGQPPEHDLFADLSE